MNYFHAAGVGLTAATLSLAVLCGYRSQPIDVQAVEVVAPAASAVVATPPSPICISQNCYPQAKFLQCVYEATNSSYSTRYCTKWEIQYEHHCDCNKWAPAEAP